MSESATVMIPEPMPMFGPVQLAAVRSRHHGSTNLSGAVMLNMPSSATTRLPKPPFS